MTEHVCDDCGTRNAADARFCVGCDEYLGWDSANNRPDPDKTNVMPRMGARRHWAPVDTESRAQAPEVKLPDAAALLDPEADVAVQIRNPSTIVDAYTLTAVQAPPWLTLSHPEITLMPGTTELATATLGTTPGSLIPAQTLTIGLRVRSERDTTRFTDVPMTVTVPQHGPAVKLTARPTAVRLVDVTTGGFEVLLDNTSSNYPHNVALAGTDAESKVNFTFSPPWLVVEPGQSATALAEFSVPEIRPGETQVRRLTITATEDNAVAEATVVVNQERTVAPPLRFRIEPSSPHVRDAESVVVTLVVDNRESATTRTVRFDGRDPAGAVRFAFANAKLSVPANRAVTTSVRISATPPPRGEEYTRPFTVVASYGDGEIEAPGTFVQSTSVTAYSVSRLVVTPETLRTAEPQGEFQYCIENRHETQWLQAGMSGSDVQGVVQFEFSPPGFDVPPGGAAWGVVSVTAPAPVKRGEEATRDLEITASSGDESLTTKATFIHSGWNWIPIVQAAMIVFGGVLAMWGAAEPWASNVRLFNGRWLIESSWWSNSTNTGLIDKINQYGIMFLWHQTPDQFVAFSQPPERISIFVLAIALVVTAFASIGRWSILVALLIAALAVGYWLLLLISLAWQHASAGFPSYGIMLVLLGAAIGFAGGMWARVTNR